MKFFLIVFFGLIATSIGSDIDNSESYYSSSEYSSEEIEERVTGGIQMTKENYPDFNYQVGMLIDDGGPGEYICGGALIHEQIVLTAAHCLVDCVRVGIFMGTAVKPARIDSPGNIVVPRNYIIIHENFDINTYLDDIATIYLPSPVRLSKYLNTIELASSRFMDCETCGPSEKFWVSGWGKINDYEYPDTMNYAEVVPLPVERCFNGYRDPKGIRQLCTTHEGNTGSCSGDSGGPYVYELSNGRRFLCGLNSFNFGGNRCEDSVPRGKTAVSFYHDNGWICRNSYGLVGC